MRILSQLVQFLLHVLKTIQVQVRMKYYHIQYNIMKETLNICGDLSHVYTLQLVKYLQEQKLPQLEKTVKRVRMQPRRSSPVRKHKDSKIVSRAPISSRGILR